MCCLLFLLYLEHHCLQLVVIEEQPGQPGCSSHEAGGNSRQLVVGQIQGLQSAVNRIMVTINVKGGNIVSWL